MTYTNMRKSCEIFINYGLNDWFDADHEIIFGPSLDNNFSDEDMNKLEELGWFQSDECDCWATHC